MPGNHHLHVAAIDHCEPRHDINMAHSISLINVARNNSSAQRQKGLTGYCVKYIDRPFCLGTDALHFERVLWHLSEQYSHLFRNYDSIYILL